MTSDLLRARDEITRWLAGTFHANLSDALRWERLKLGRVRFKRGVPTWVAA